MSTPTPQNLPKNKRALDSTLPIPTTFYGQLSLARFPRDEGRGVAERSDNLGDPFYLEEVLRGETPSTRMRPRLHIYVWARPTYG